MHRPDLDSPAWHRLRLRVLARDGRRCTVGRLLGGPCHPTLHVHHLIPVSEGGPPFDEDNAVTACARHHPMLEAMRRALLERRQRPLAKCRHKHRYDHARRECRARRENEQRAA